MGHGIREVKELHNLPLRVLVSYRGLVKASGVSRETQRKLTRIRIRAHSLLVASLNHPLICKNKAWKASNVGTVALESEPGRRNRATR